MIVLALALLTMFQDVAPTPPVKPEPPDPRTVIESFYAQKDWEPAADPAAPEWTGIPAVEATRDSFGNDVPGPGTEIRSRWTHKYLYLLFSCPYQELNTKPDPVTDRKTNKLWDFDVAEAFIGSDYLNTAKYKEFQVSPQGEFVDLDIDPDNSSNEKSIAWDSGMTVSGRIDAEKKVWYGEMRIPFPSLDVKQARLGDEMRIGFYRIAGKEPNRIYLAWRPTGASTFHVPDAFGSLVLEKEPGEKPEEKK